MKTAISVRDNLFERIDSYSKARKISRSQLFCEAAEEYLEKRENNDITANLNAVYSVEDSSVDPVLLKMALMSLPEEEW
ncbi:MAG: ribbon-helix-helix protein, CopG family [Pyrinomonadaceae bacterium]